MRASKIRNIIVCLFDCSKLKDEHTLERVDEAKLLVGQAVLIKVQLDPSDEATKEIVLIWPEEVSREVVLLTSM